MACSGSILRILLTRCRTGIQTVHHHGIVFTVAIGIHRPAELGAIVVALNHAIVEVDVQPDVGPGLCLVEERLAHSSLHTFWTDSRYGIFCVVGE